MDHLETTSGHFEAQVGNHLRSNWEQLGDYLAINWRLLGAVWALLVFEDLLGTMYLWTNFKLLDDYFATSW